MTSAALGCAAASPAPRTAPDPNRRADDIAAARALFERNIAAIQAKDRDGYLGCYRADEALVRVGPEGPKLGFAELASSTSTDPAEWPSSLKAEGMDLHWLGPGYVYGLYRYAVVIKGVETKGISERVIVERDGRWQIEVTTAFGSCP